MPRDRKSRLYRREWLNGPTQGTAYVEAEVPVQTEAGTFYHEGSHLTLADCSRVVALSFPLHSRDQRENSLAKIALLQEIVEQFATALLQEANLAEAAEQGREAAERAQAVRRARAEDRLVLRDAIDTLDEIIETTLLEGQVEPGSTTLPRGHVDERLYAMAVLAGDIRRVEVGPDGERTESPSAFPGDYVMVRSETGLQVMPRQFLPEGMPTLSPLEAILYVAGEGPE
jgi:hypothetical protein